MRQRGKIPEAFINDLLARADILDIIGEFVSLKRYGNSHKGLCPFHQEKTPSFHVNRVKQVYHCFGCGAGGSLISFLMDYQNLSFVEAIESVAERYGVAVPREGLALRQSRQEQNRAKELYDANEQAATFYRNELSRSPNAREYLRSRKVDEENARRFMLGYAPKSNDALGKHLAKNFSPKLLEAAGLVYINVGQCRDRFINRLIFPIRDRRGRVIAFGGRALDNNAQVKYLNSPETALFKKRLGIYGGYEMTSLRRYKEVWVVEGYMDVVSLSCGGMRNCVATLGTAVSAAQIKLMLRICERIIFCFDGDAAGRKAAAATAATAIALFKDGQDIRFSLMPENSDPDDLMRERGASAFDAEQAIPLSRFILHGLEEGLSVDSVEGRSQLVERARKMFFPLPRTTFKSILIQEVAKKTGVNTSELVDRPRAAKSLLTKPSKNYRRDHMYSPARLAALFLLHNPARVDENLDEARFKQTGIRGGELLAELVGAIRSFKPRNTGALLELLSGHKHYHRLAALLNEEPPNENEFLDVMQKLKACVGKTRAEKLISKAESGEINAAEKKELQELLKKSY